MSTGDNIHYGDPFYLTTTADSVASQQGITTCRTGVRKPFVLISFVDNMLDSLKLKFVSAKNRGDFGPVKRDDDVYIALFDNDDTKNPSPYFRVSGSTSDMKWKCNKYVTVPTGDDNDVWTGGLSLDPFHIRDQNNDTGQAIIQYNSINYISGTGSAGTNYFSYCGAENITNSHGCAGPAVAWQSSSKDDRLKFVIHRYPDECVDLGGGCGDLEPRPCCQSTQGGTYKPPSADKIHCIDNSCRWCAENGMLCNPDEDGDSGVFCCSGVCGPRGYDMVCKPFLDVGDPCTHSSQCGSSDMGLLCNPESNLCEECNPDPAYEGPLKCTCLGRMTACEEGGSLKCCDPTDCIYDRQVGKYICTEEFGVVIPLVGWIVIIVSAVLLLMVVYFLVRVSSGGSSYLKKQRKAAGLEPTKPPAGPGAKKQKTK